MGKTIDLDFIEKRFSGTELPEPGDEPRFPSPDPTSKLKQLKMTTEIKPAAVLIPLIDRPEPTVLLTKRTSHLKHHAGQISFPGGRMEMGETPVEAALRETHEEVGLGHHSVSIIGYLDKYIVGTGFSVYPVVARVKPDFTLNLDSFEVAEAFEVPLKFALEPANFGVTSRLYGTTELSFYEAFYAQYRIWGATAGMLVGLGEFVKK